MKAKYDRPFRTFAWATAFLLIISVLSCSSSHAKAAVDPLEKVRRENMTTTSEIGGNMKNRREPSRPGLSKSMQTAIKQSLHNQMTSIKPRALSLLKRLQSLVAAKGNLLDKAEGINKEGNEENKKYDQQIAEWKSMRPDLMKILKERSLLDRNLQRLRVEIEYLEDKNDKMRQPGSQLSENMNYLQGLKNQFDLLMRSLVSKDQETKNLINQVQAEDSEGVEALKNYYYDKLKEEDLIIENGRSSEVYSFGHSQSLEEKLKDTWTLINLYQTGAERAADLLGKRRDGLAQTDQEIQRLQSRIQFLGESWRNASGTLVGTRSFSGKLIKEAEQNADVSRREFFSSWKDWKEYLAELNEKLTFLKQSWQREVIILQNSLSDYHQRSRICQALQMHLNGLQSSSTVMISTDNSILKQKSELELLIHEALSQIVAQENEFRSHAVEAKQDHGEYISRLKNKHEKIIARASGVREKEYETRRIADEKVFNKRQAEAQIQIRKAQKEVNKELKERMEKKRAELKKMESDLRRKLQTEYAILERKLAEKKASIEEQGLLMAKINERQIDLSNSHEQLKQDFEKRCRTTAEAEEALETKKQTCLNKLRNRRSKLRRLTKKVNDQTNFVEGHITHHLNSLHERERKLQMRDRFYGKSQRKLEARAYRLNENHQKLSQTILGLKGQISQILQRKKLYQIYSKKLRGLINSKQGFLSAFRSQENLRVEFEKSPVRMRDPSYQEGSGIYSNRAIMGNMPNDCRQFIEWITDSLSEPQRLSSNRLVEKCSCTNDPFSGRAIYRAGNPDDYYMLELYIFEEEGKFQGETSSKSIVILKYFSNYSESQFTVSTFFGRMDDISSETMIRKLPEVIMTASELTRLKNAILRSIPATFFAKSQLSLSPDVVRADKDQGWPNTRFPQESTPTRLVRFDPITGLVLDGALSWYIERPIIKVAPIPNDNKLFGGKQNGLKRSLLIEFSMGKLFWESNGQIQSCTSHDLSFEDVIRYLYDLSESVLVLTPYDHAGQYGRLFLFHPSFQSHIPTGLVYFSPSPEASIGSSDTTLDSPHLLKLLDLPSTERLLPVQIMSYEPEQRVMKLRLRNSNSMGHFFIRFPNEQHTILSETVFPRLDLREE